MPSAATAGPAAIAPAAPDRPAHAAPWDTLRARAGAATAGLPAPPEPGPGVCVVCRAPSRRGHQHCFHCGLHTDSAPGLLADAVAPVAYAPKGGRLATDLWRYKSAEPGAAAARTALRAMLLVFLHDHGEQVWQRAGVAAPTHVCVVPSGRGRPGAHPLQALVQACLTLPWLALHSQPGADSLARTLDPGRFRAARPLLGAAVLLLDDTWVTGASVQSAAAALKRAGARSVAAVVLGRHMRARAVLPTRAATPPS